MFHINGFSCYMGKLLWELSTQRLFFVATKLLCNNFFFIRSNHWNFFSLKNFHFNLWLCQVNFLFEKNLFPNSCLKAKCNQERENGNWILKWNWCPMEIFWVFKLFLDFFSCYRTNQKIHSQLLKVVEAKMLRLRI